MPFTLLQAQDDYIFRSFIAFLDRNVKAPYDITVHTTSGQSEDYSTPLQLRVGTPDDPTIVNNPPTIAVSMIPVRYHPFYELGGSIWRYRSFQLCCYPCLRIPDGAPSDQAAMVLSSYVQNAVETESIRVLDYSNISYTDASPIYCNDNMLIEDRTAPTYAKLGSLLAQEKHRFDVNVTVKFVVQGSLAT